MKTKKTEQFLEKAFIMVPRMKRALSFKMSSEILRYDLTLPHLLILRELAYNSAPCMKELVKKLDISCAMMTRFVDQLEKKKLVVRERSGSDRRRVHVLLTKKGQSMIENIRQMHKERFKEFLSGFDFNDRERFIEAFEELYRLVIKYGEGTDA